LPAFWAKTCIFPWLVPTTTGASHTKCKMFWLPINFIQILASPASYHALQKVQKSRDPIRTCEVASSFWDFTLSENLPFTLNHSLMERQKKFHYSNSTLLVH